MNAGRSRKRWSIAPSAAMALERFWALIDRWRDDVAALTDEQLDMVGFSQYPYDGGLFGHRGPSSLSPNTVAVPGLAIANSAVSASICSIAAVSAGRGREGHDDEPFGPRGECPPEHGLFRPAHELAHSRKTVQSRLRVAGIPDGRASLAATAAASARRWRVPP